MQYIYIGLIRFIDNAISTSKNIALYKNKYFISSLLEALSAVLFIFIVSNIYQGDTIFLSIALGIGAFCGKYIACIISDKFSKDITYTNIITSDSENIDEIQKLYKECLDNNIIAILINSDDTQNLPTKTLLIESKTKEQSKIVDIFIKNSDKTFLRRII